MLWFHECKYFIFFDNFHMERFFVCFSHFRAPIKILDRDSFSRWYYLQDHLFSIHLWYNHKINKNTSTKYRLFAKFLYRRLCLHVLRFNREDTHKKCVFLSGRTT